jgi:hypothetical protein
VMTRIGLLTDIAAQNDCLTGMHCVFRRELSVRDWWRLLRSKELAWLRWNDPVLFNMIWVRLAMASVATALRVPHFPFQKKQPAKWFPK